MRGTFTGICVGGPYDGRPCCHYSKQLNIVLQPELAFMDVGKEDFEKEIDVKTGTYLFRDGEWRWQT